MAKVLKFTKNKTLNLDKSPEVMCEVIQCGIDRFTLKDFRLQFGHDDSIPYHAILCVNELPICECLNDGWGGQTDLTPLNDRYYSAQDNLKDYKWSYGKMEFDLTLDFIADTLACTAELKHGK